MDGKTFFLYYNYNENNCIMALYGIMALKINLFSIKININSKKN
jgi:hypothetical protein